MLAFGVAVNGGDGLAVALIWRSLAYWRERSRRVEARPRRIR